MIRRWSRRRLVGLSFITIFLGIMLLLVMVYLLWKSLSFLPGSISTNATITGCQIDSDPTICKPIADFKAQNGQKITVRPQEGSTSLHPGDTIPVWYHADKPEDTRTDLGIGNILKPLMYLIIAPILIIFGLVYLWFAGEPYLPQMIRKWRNRRSAAVSYNASSHQAKSGGKSEVVLTSSKPRPKKSKPPAKHRKRR